VGGWEGIDARKNVNKQTAERGIFQAEAGCFELQDKILGALIFTPACMRNVHFGFALHLFLIMTNLT
jgi:hypothetical protein